PDVQTTLRSRQKGCHGIRLDPEVRQQRRRGAPHLPDRSKGGRSQVLPERERQYSGSQRGSAGGAWRIEVNRVRSRGGLPCRRGSFLQPRFSLQCVPPRRRIRTSSPVPFGEPAARRAKAVLSVVVR